MHIEKLNYFVDLYDCGSFSKTAKKNYISQASISQYITSLENEFEVKLFDRSRTPIEPKTFGKVFYQQAKLLLRQFDETKSQLASIKKLERPTLSLGYTSLNDLKIILPYIIYLKDKQINLEVELEKVDCKNIESYVEKGLCDLGLSFTDEFSREYVKKYILKSGNYHALVGYGHPLFNNKLIKVEELYQYPLLMLSEESLGESYWKMQERSIEDGYFPNVSRTVTDFEEGFFFIISDQLIGFGTDDYNLDNLNGLIRSIPIEGSNHTYDIVLTYLEDYKKPIIEQFIKHLNSYYQEF